jgi:hypothetical protein
MVNTTAKCFGLNFGFNTQGWLGTGDITSYNTPQPFASGISGILEIATGRLTTCVAMASFDVRCVGGDTQGQLGNGSPNSDSLGLVTVLFETTRAPV